MKPSLVLRPIRCLLTHRRRAALILGLTLLLVLLAHPRALADDVYGNIAPAPQLPPGGWAGRYPVEHYQLDQYFSAISVGFTSGVDASGVAPMIAYFGAQILWLITCFLANGVTLLFALAFNLNLLTGNGARGSGALTPISQAIHNMYTSTFGTPWLIAVVTLIGCWAIWKALIQRQYTATASALAVSFLYFILAVGIVTQPEKTIVPASKLSNEMSTAILSLTNEGNIGDEEKAKTVAGDQLFELLVLNPWTVLEFGGIEHCATVSHGKPTPVAVRPLSSNPAEETRLASQLENGTEVKGEDGKICINNRNKYATHFLQYRFQSPNRNSEHAALEHGDEEDLPQADSSKNSGAYPLAPADEPAAEAMGKAGQYQRLLLAFVILLGEVGAYLLLGALALGVILAQILLLALLAFAPVALLVGIFPGRGHEFFRKWLGKLVGYLARKVVYSLILAVVLAVCSALDSATSNLGWLLAFGLQAAFLWTIFLQRKKLTEDLLSGTVGRPQEDGHRLADLYFASRLARMVPAPGIPRLPSLPSLPKMPWSKSGGGSGSETPPTGESPRGGSPAPAPPAGDPPPPTAGAGGGGEGGEPGGEGYLPNPPSPHETPTHGPGSPTPSTGGSEGEEPPGDAPAEGEPPPAAPPEAPPPPPAVEPIAAQPGGVPTEDELPLGEPASEARVSQSPARPAADPEGTRSRATSTEPSPSNITSAGEVTSTVLNSTLARSAASPKRAPAEPPSPASAPPPPARPAPMVAAAPGASQAASRDDALSEDMAPARPPTDTAEVKPDAGPAVVPAPAIEGPSPGQEPVARLLNARQSSPPADPATPEDELA
ncbi:MAG TPA: type IV secretion system protein [Solirubrobacteraceae bacterium]|nr:type IV secretion system protein [Solirubrobacteraceae bacterium]